MSVRDPLIFQSLLFSMLRGWLLIQSFSQSTLATLLSFDGLETVLMLLDNYECISILKLAISVSP